MLLGVSSIVSRFVPELTAVRHTDFVGRGDGRVVRGPSRCRREFVFLDVFRGRIPATRARVFSSIEIKIKLPWMRPQFERVDFTFALVFDPGLDDVVGENIAFAQKCAVGLQRGE
jgi:hypothetical protein